MDWYIKKLGELKNAKPLISVCGDDCAVCPRFVASSDEELFETALFWKKLGFRDRVLSNEEIKCTGCGCRQNCSFNILPCTKNHGVLKCKDCKDCNGFSCDKINAMLESSSFKKEQCKAACKTDEEFMMLCRAFYEKEKNLKY